jgi:hypothetical protein
LLEASLDRITSELASVVGMEVECCDLEVSREKGKPVVGEGVHLSFRIGLLAQGDLRHGCLVLGFEPAMEAAGQLLGRPESERDSAIKSRELDSEWKEGLLEVSSVFGAAIDVALRDGVGVDVHACSEGCQGVTEGSTPILEMGEHAELLVGRFQWRPEGMQASDGFLVVDL